MAIKSIRLILVLFILSVGLFFPSGINIYAQIHNGISLDEAVSNVFQNLFKEGYNEFIATVVGIPAFVILIIFVYFQKSVINVLIYMFFGLALLLLIMAAFYYSYWDEAYGPERMRSTSALIFVAIPFYYAFGLGIGLLLANIVCRIHPRLIKTDKQEKTAIK